MSVLALTIFVTLALVLFFVVLFIQQMATGGSRPEDALRPLDEETPSITPRPSKHAQ